MKTKTRRSYTHQTDDNFPLLTTSFVGKYMERQGLTYIADGNINGYMQFGENSGLYVANLKLLTTCDSATPNLEKFLSICPRRHLLEFP